MATTVHFISMLCYDMMVTAYHMLHVVFFR